MVGVLRERVELAVQRRRKEERQTWVKRLVKYCRRVNQMGRDEVINMSDWLFNLDMTVALECLKRPSSVDSEWTERVLREVKARGGVRGCMRYMEYLTMECGGKDERVHTELACLYVQYINSTL